MNSFKIYSFRRMSVVILLCGGLTGVSSCFTVTTNTKVAYRVNRSSGALNSISIPDDSTNMNWIVAADGSQYRWVTESLGWGLGYFTINGSRICRWEKPLHVIGDSISEYRVGDVQIVVFRKTVSDGFKESYKFTNKGSETVRLSDIGILTPFNDNYPDSRTCVNARCNREMFGDVFPHYWSTLTASAFHFYSLCTGEDSWQKRAEKIVENNLCLFMPDGTASCAYIYPRRVNGKPGKFFDPYANDQDWALAYYLQVKENIW